MAEGKYVNGKSYGGDNWRSSLVFDNLLMFNQTWGKHNVSANRRNLLGSVQQL